MLRPTLPTTKNVFLQLDKASGKCWFFELLMNSCDSFKFSNTILISVKVSVKCSSNGGHQVHQPTAHSHIITSKNRKRSSMFLVNDSSLHFECLSIFNHFGNLMINGVNFLNTIHVISPTP